MKTGLTTCMIAYNEEFWLPYTLPLVVSNSDAVIFIDGSPNGPSTDRTAIIASRFLRSGIDTYICGQFGSELEDDNWDKTQRNIYLPLIETSHFLVLDADEAYDKDGWDAFRILVEENAPGAYNPIVHFWINDKHCLKIGPFAANAHRFLAYRPGMYYRDTSTAVYLEDGTPAIYQSNIVHLPITNQFHYGHASPSEVYKQKQAKFKRRNDGGALSLEEYDNWLVNWKDERDLGLGELIDILHPLNLVSKDIWGR